MVMVKLENPLRDILTNKNLEFEIFDENIAKFNKKYNLNDFDQILCSPGISKSNYEKLIKEHNNVLTDIDIFFKLINQLKLVLQALIGKAQQHIISFSYLKIIVAQT